MQAAVDATKTNVEKKATLSIAVGDNMAGNIPNFFDIYIYIYLNLLGGFVFICYISSRCFTTKVTTSWSIYVGYIGGVCDQK